MNDLISRQAAIKALADDMPQTYTPDGSHYADDDIFKAQEIYADCITRLEELPSAEPEPPECICGECDAWNKYKSERKTKRQKNVHWYLLDTSETMDGTGQMDFRRSYRL